MKGMTFCRKGALHHYLEVEYSLSKVLGTTVFQIWIVLRFWNIYVILVEHLKSEMFRYAFPLRHFSTQNVSKNVGAF